MDTCYPKTGIRARRKVATRAILTACVAGAAILSIAGARPAQAQSAYFTLSLNNGKWQLIAPSGRPFFIKGVHGVRYAGDPIQGTVSPYQQTTQSRYGGSETWAKAVAANLRSWGFNTIGANSDSVMNRQGLAFTVLLNLSKGAEIRGVDMPDVFDNQWIQTIQQTAQKYCTPLVHNTSLIGYFSDNELHWVGDYKTREPLLKLYLELPQNSKGYAKALGYCQIHNLDPSHFSPSDAAGFQKDVAYQYFKVTYAAIKAVDPNHLVLGCRFATPGLLDNVLKGIDGNTDVVSWNTYRLTAPISEIDHITSVTNLPVLVSEWSIESKDSGLPNTVNANSLVDTEQERASLVEKYVRDLEADPNCIGYIWFKYVDDPPQGALKPGGENSNFGLVRNSDQPYQMTVDALSSANKADQD